MVDIRHLDYEKRGETIEVLLDFINKQEDVGVSDYANLMLDSNLWSLSEAINYMKDSGFNEDEIKVLLGYDD